MNLWSQLLLSSPTPLLLLPLLLLLLILLLPLLLLMTFHKMLSILTSSQLERH